MKLTVLYARAKSKFLASLILYQHQIEWVRVGQPIPRTPLLVTAGGDGTINYAINNIDLAETRLIVLPLGRGNALARILNLSFCPINERDLEHAEEVGIPLLEVNGRLAVFGAGMGKGSEIVNFANPYWQLGTSSYIVGAIKSIQVNPAYKICINGELHLDLLAVEASLWGKVGFGLPLTWQDTPGLSLTLIKGHPFYATVLLLLGQIPEWEGATTLSGNSFVLESEVEIPAHIDGETFPAKRMKVMPSFRRGRIIRPGKLA
ncbi:MAG: lipid kinase YegS [Firmicutes bacterium]|nr:lipid kinase YegS [Bacillota bacterium]